MWRSTLENGVGLPNASVCTQELAGVSPNKGSPWAINGVQTPGNDVATLKMASSTCECAG